MKLLKATIYGFGRWVDYEIDFSKQSFTAIYGENESGKTTIQAFLLFMLFGLPPKQRKFYQPKTSSKMGGRLEILDDEIGEYIIERLGDTRKGAALCFTSDGNEYGESWLRERLFGINEKTYRSIFSFSALDLSRLQDVKEEDLSEVLLGIGLTGSSRIHTVGKRLEQKLSEYFKPYGKNPMINQQLAKIEELQREIQELKREEATYREKKNGILALESDIESLIQKIKSQKEQKYQLEKIIHVLPQVEEYIHYQNRLASLPVSIAFPEEGLERLEALKEKMLPIKSDIKIRVRNKNHYVEEKEKLEAENNRFPYDDAKRIYINYSHYQENERELLRIQNQLNELDKQINSTLIDLNIGLDREVLDDIHLPFHLEKEWNDLRTVVEEIHRDQESNKESIQLQQSEHERLELALKNTEEKLLTNEMRKEYEDIINTHNENKLIEAFQQDNFQKQKNWANTKTRTNKRIRLVLSVCIMLGIVFGIIGLLFDMKLSYSFSAISFVLGISQWVFGKKSINNMEAMIKDSVTIQADRTITTEEMQRAENQLRVNQEHIREFEFLTDKLSNSAIALRKLQDQKVILADREADIHKNLVEQKSQFPFLEKVDVVYWTDIYHSLKGLLQVVKNIVDLRSNQAELKENQFMYQNNVDTFLQENYLEMNAKTMASKLDFLETEIHAYEDREKQILQTEKVLHDTQAQLEELFTKCETVENEIITLFEFANTEDEEGFYLKAKELNEQKELCMASEKIAVQISGYFSKEEWENLVTNPPKKSTVELEMKEIGNNIFALEEELESKRRQLAKIIVEFQKLESSETYSKTLHKFSMEKEKLVKLSRQWAVYKTAKDLLVETKDNYRDKYLSKVITKTEFFFTQLTEGVYTKVYPPVDDKPFSVERIDHLRFTVQELSQGTVNQLYVSLRLAISEVMSETMHLPFMIDDAFVHFDKRRNKVMIQILEEVANRHQILLFTCKHEIATEIRDINLLQLTNSLSLVENEG